MSTIHRSFCSCKVTLCVFVRQIFGSRVRVDSIAKVADIELAEKEKMKEKVDRILKHGINCFINRYRHVRLTHTQVLTEKIQDKNNTTDGTENASSNHLFAKKNVKYSSGV